MISIIDELDIPLLSHYVDDQGNNILRYFITVDNNSFYNIVWKAKEINIFNYLNNKITLRELILEDDKEFFYLDKNVNITGHDEVEMIPVNSISEDFLPDGDSYYGFSIPKQYEPLLQKYNSGFYVASLKDRGVVLRIAPKEKKYGDTVSLENVADFTSNIYRSYHSYVEQEFYKCFKESIPDIKTFEKTKRHILTKTVPRVCDAEFGSFEITISYDRLSNENLRADLLEWTFSILSSYADNVLYIDYANDATVKNLLEKASPLELKSIYEPLLNSLGQKEYVVNVRSIGTDKSITFNKNYKATKKELRKRVLDNKDESSSVQSKKKLVHLILELDETKEVGQLKKSELNKDIIISYETKSFEYAIESIDRPESKYFLEKPIEFEVEITDDNLYYIESNFLDEALLVENKQSLRDEIMQSLQNMIAKKYSDDIMKFFSDYNIKFK